METSLPELLSSLRDELVLTPDFFGNIDCDEILSLRDEDKSFDSEWNRCYNVLDKKYAEQDISEEVDLLIEEIREQSFAIANQGMEEHELASSISDDFELFARAIVLDYIDPFLDAMWEAYENGEVPSPETLSEVQS